MQKRVYNIKVIKHTIKIIKYICITLLLIIIMIIVIKIDI